MRWSSTATRSGCWRSCGRPTRAATVHLVGGPRTIETFRALGGLDKLALIVLPLLFGAGMQLTPTFNPDTELTLKSHRALPGGSVELIYAC